MRTKHLARRRYQELVRFYKETVKNPIIAHRVRMQAAARLDAILERHERQQDQAITRAERAAQRALEEREAAVRYQTPAGQDDSSVKKEPDIGHRVFSELLNGKRATK